MRILELAHLVVARLRREVGDFVFNRRPVARLSRRHQLWCLGDSHVAVLRQVALDGVWLRVRDLHGATASGILNPNSNTHAFTTFSALLERARPWQSVLIQLGEVDCGFIIWHRAQRHGLTIEAQLDETLTNYMTFVQQVVDRGFARVLVLSVPLPTITDYPSQWGEVANLRKEVTATQAERTELTLRFNAQLRERCEAAGVIFVDATTAQLDPSTELIDAAFVRDSHLDHHLEDAPYAALIGQTLRPALTS